MNRRGAVAFGSMGLGAALMGRRASANQATPVAEATPVVTDEVEILFVQSFATGAFVEGATGAGEYTLTLENGSGQTVYFSDRPERLVGAIADETFLDGRAFDAADPPNAAIVAQTANGEDILVVELLDPAYDAASGTVSYTVRPLDGQPESAALASYAALQEDSALDATFGPVSLFIDNLTCGPAGTSCHSESDCCSGNCCVDIEECPPYACL
ncbi:MAG: hypothetical protein M3457_10165 [Chloroflexota bacterium]|nr:hypothetical protein [Chloroflexota bacterium]